MTTPEERTMTVFRVQTFLVGLILGAYKRVPREVRCKARSLLKHYPMACDLLSRDAWDKRTVQKWGSEMDSLWRGEEDRA